MNFEWQLVRGMAGNVAEILLSGKGKIEKIEEIKFSEAAAVGEIRRYSKNSVAEKCPLENLELNFGSGLFCPQFLQFGSYVRCSRMKF